MRLLTLIILLFVLVCNVGCIAPIALSTAGSVGTDTPVVFHHFAKGEAEAFCKAKYDDVVAATSHAGEVLSLEANEKKIDKDQAFFRFYDAKKDRVDIFIESRSDTVTSIKFDVGWFGSVAFGRLMAQQIVSELNKSVSFTKNWTK